MANILPLFNSAPRMKLRLNGKTLAYAIGFNVGVSIDVQPVSIIGSHQPVALEPLMYNVVSGTLQIVRLFSNRTSAKAVADANPNAQITAKASVIEEANSDNSNNPLARSELYKHLDPRQVLASRSFDIDLYVRVPKTDGSGGEDEVPWMSIKDCRITSRNTNIAMGSLTNEPLTFQGLLATNYDATGTNALMIADTTTKETQAK
jgi:hypothetical protein